MSCFFNQLNVKTANLVYGPYILLLFIAISYADNVLLRNFINYLNKFLDTNVVNDHLKFRTEGNGLFPAW